MGVGEQMKQLPCITEKCLKYPTCKNKEVVMCNLVRDYCIYLIKDVSSRSLRIKTIEKALPKLNEVQSESKEYPIYINRREI